ncbi:MAG: TonB-dependent receptor, partial [Methylocella sp.]
MLAATIASASTSEGPYSLGEIQVTAGALDFHYLTPFAIDEISLKPGNSNRSLSELLDSLPGLRVTRYGLSGGFSTLSIRGSSPGQVLVMWNGVPLNLASTGV